MSQLEQHTMHLQKTYPTGAEEWDCPICNRRILMQWYPSHKRIILEAGNQYTVHNGQKGGLQIHASQIAETEEQIISDELCDLIDEVLNGIDFGD